ncbi:threonine/serine dehydratase [Psychromarinibacter sp. C21-152]|uniref:Threonine/serine dehydratase n=1 Tax=Psychromarinibacter sediminicola TaxID=3033385 RepID=A0AAE3NW05_9RHOB|nr:threonine/serine dehydratase [Psychromarinibacter sediminicola]MDF0603306.1 threonine/serine dehydratase [Psychromarinibacter sediminicola]
MIGIDDIRAAEQRIRDRVRHTPVIEANQLKTPVAEGAQLMLKLELLQVTGSFKARGATNKLLATPPDVLDKGIVAASGGNHGLATAQAGYMAGVQVTIFLPGNVSPEKVEKLHQWGAETVIVGTVWDDANAAALERVRKTGAAYFHPFADPLVVAGQGTVGLELLHQLPQVDTVIVAIGGGGLISGVATAIKALTPHVRVIGVEAEGSPTLKNSLKAGGVITLDRVTTSIPTLACSRTDERIYELVDQHVDDIVLVTDTQMLDAAEWLWFEMGLAADLSGVAAVTALHCGQINATAGEKICAVVCGAGQDGLASGAG